MVDKIKALALILERMDALYGRVLGLLEREREALIRLEYEQLFSVVREKDEVLSAIRGLDRDRLRLQDFFAAVMDLGSEEVTLKTVGDNLVASGDLEYGNRLLALRESLGKTVELVRQKVDRNKSFIEKSVENLQKIAANLSAALTGKPGKQSRKSNVYDRNKRYEDTTAHKGAILEKRL
jgi:flagellar biosynthesis/type III secretory pathway chaperone